MKKVTLNIEDRQADYKEIQRLSWRAEQGIRAVCVMYDDHSQDKNSEENIFILKDNVHYRLFSLAHQYLVFLRELAFAERHLQQLHQKDPKLLHAFPLGNPHFEQVELELSSVFDSIIFQLSSVYDYLSHLTCYICKKDKSKSLNWTNLASASRGKGNEFSDLPIRTTIISVDSEFANRLYDYRSRLIHRKKDKHTFNTTVNWTDFNFDLKILASDVSLKHFKAIRKEYPTQQVTLTFLSSWLIKRAFIDVETILDGLREQVLSNSSFSMNLIKPKRKNGLMFITMDPKTKFAKPMSDGLWEKYKEMKK